MMGGGGTNVGTKTQSPQNTKSVHDVMTRGREEVTFCLTILRIDTHPAKQLERAYTKYYANKKKLF